VLLVVMTTCLSFALFELVRRMPLLRPLFGLTFKARESATRPTPELVAANAA
jgi:hypothetical protein